MNIDLKGKSTIADNMVVATGTSSRQVAALAERLLQRLKGLGFVGLKPEGLRQGDWVLIDSGDVIVHLFRPEIRSFYNIEKMWGVALDRDGRSSRVGGGPGAATHSMRLTIASAGRFRDGPERSLFQRYCGRIRWDVRLREIEAKGRAAPAEVARREADLLAACCPAGAYVVALDAGGRMLSSEEFARTLGDLRDGGRRGNRFSDRRRSRSFAAAGRRRRPGSGLRVGHLAPLARPRHADGADLPRPGNPRRSSLSPRKGARLTATPLACPSLYRHRHATEQDGS